MVALGLLFLNFYMEMLQIEIPYQVLLNLNDIFGFFISP